MSAIRKLHRIPVAFWIAIFCAAISSFADVSQKRFDFKKAPVRTEAIAENPAPVVTPKEAPTEIKTSSSYFFIGSDAMWKWLVSSQKDLREKISAQVLALKGGRTQSVALFLLICFIYGLVHAIGPGHGKSIVAGYFLARRGKILQGIGLGTSITVIHTLSAVILLFILYAIAKTMLFPIFEASRIQIERGSYALIIFSGVLLIAISLREFFHSTPEKDAPTDASWKELLWLAFITGIVPCPAVALVVFFCLLNDLPFLALLGAAAIGVGMSVTNTGFGLGAIFIRRGIDGGIRHVEKLERRAALIHVGLSLFCGLCIALLGVFLFLNAR